MSKKLTDEQIKNWRRVLVGMFGPYALIMPKEQIQQYFDKLNNKISKMPNKPVHPTQGGTV